MNISRPPMAFLFDVDNTLLDNDSVIVDLKQYLQEDVGSACARLYWHIFEKIRAEIGYADYLGAMQHYRAAYPNDMRILTVSRFLLDYPFADRLFPYALDVITHVSQWGPVALLTDGDVVFQPWKVDRSGLSDAVDGHVFIYKHKEEALFDVEKRFPAGHYVVFEDKLRLLTAIKKDWESRVTTVFLRQGHYALDPKMLSDYPAADISFDRIGDLLQHGWSQ